MKDAQYILLNHFCQHAAISDSFVESLIELDMIRHKNMNNDYYILEDEISEIERMFRLHDDLGVNIAGIGVINEMLYRLQDLEQEINYLKQKLAIYED